MKIRLARIRKIKRGLKHSLWLVAPLLLSFLFFKKKHITIYLIGDSTMCIYQPDSSHLTGWGMPFAKFFDSTVTIINKAVGGESTRTFIEEKLWQPVSDNLKAGDYLLIQFGHNDEIPYKKSQELLQQFGPEKSKELFVALGANPWVPKDQEDITHFNEFGAAQMAAIILEESKALKLEWTNRTIQPQR